MKISRTKFVLFFLLTAIVFQFISNSILGPEVRLFPINGDFFPGANSTIDWHRVLAAILYPIKLILIGPPSLLFAHPDPDPAPPVILIAFALYWTALAVLLHFLLGKLFNRKKA